jgi:hypothetical protein
VTEPHDLHRTRAPLWLWGLIAVFGLAFAALVVSSLSRPDPPVFALAPPEERDPPASLAGPDTVTLDARAGERWTRFDLARRKLAGPMEPWDLAVKRHRLAVNGGRGLAGLGGVIRLDRPFAEVVEAPADGYQPSRVTPNGDTVNTVLDAWYGYSFFSHLLSPEPATFVLRTHDGRYAKLAILGYYCPGPDPGCLTLAYVYQGDGSTRLTP